MSKDEILKAVNNNLRWWPWGGECFEVYRNEWGEWIANCHVWGPYSREEYGPRGRFFSDGDKDCPVRQFMVQILNEASLWVHLWEAKDNKRLPTFVEEGGVYDENAPKSPYIKTYEPKSKMPF